MVGGLSGMDGWWFGCLRYVCCPAVAPSVLTHFACSQRCHFNSLWVVACATHCTILTTSSTTSIIAIAAVLALLIALIASQLDLLASMA